MTDPSLLVLASLADSDKHGYAMILDIEQFAGVRLGPGTLYGAITRLEQRGWIKPVATDDRRQPYRITGAGRAHLKERLASLGQIVKTGQTRLDQARDFLTGWVGRISSGTIHRVGRISVSASAIHRVVAPALQSGVMVAKICPNQESRSVTGSHPLGSFTR